MVVSSFLCVICHNIKTLPWCRC